MKFFLSIVLTASLCLYAGIPGARAAGPDEAYIKAYFTVVAAASCRGIYTPDDSGEFSFLRNNGWNIRPVNLKVDGVDINYSVASGYYRQIGKKLCIVAFRGSASREDWRINIKTDKVNFGGHTLQQMQEIAAAPLIKGGPAVHKGFNRYADAVLESAGRYDGGLRETLEEVKEGKAVMLLTGHSLGGAVATLVGEKLAALGLPADRFFVITFGAPAVGNAAFASAYGGSIRLLRITNTADPVPGSLQTFFGGYKQFGEHYKYHIPTKISNMQHAMAMYFDYSVDEFYREYDKAVAEGSAVRMPDSRITPGVPVVALWFRDSPNLKKYNYTLAAQRFMQDEYMRMFPSYVVMDRHLEDEADVMRKSREAGAEYVLICGLDARMTRKQKYIYLTMEQHLFSAGAQLLASSSWGSRVAPGLGNIQSVGDMLMQGRKDLQQHLPFIITKHEPEF